MAMNTAHPRFPLTPGVVGGLGPHAHLWLERRLLELSADRFGARGDGDYPPWVLVSIPQTPDRTAALLAGGDNPTPFLLDALEKLKAAGADFAAIACNTMHAFLPRLGNLPLPAINAVTESADWLSSQCPLVRQAGLLATTGTCRSGLFAEAMAGHKIDLICPDDRAQDELVMTAIYGPTGAGGRRAGGIKAGLLDVSGASGPTPQQMLLNAAGELISRGAQAVVVACSEISLAIRPGQLAVPVIDTMDVLAETILDVASGKRKLP